VSRRPSRFTESDITRILRVARKLDVDVVIEVRPDGTITVQTGQKGEAPQLDTSGEINEWDKDYGTQATEVRPGDSKPRR
jgi:hypothetical protein